MKIGEIINTIDVRNSSLEDLQLLGLSMEKKFINSVANTIGTDMSKYKILCKNQFATNFIHVGRDGKVPIALYQGEKALVSSAYETFEVKDTSKILPEYLFLWFKRSEFDREATFYASAGIRGGFDWEDFINMKIHVPSIEEQRRVVAEYQTVERRIKNNEALIQKLEETAQAIYHHTFVEGIDENNLPEGWKKGCLGEFMKISSGKSTTDKIENQTNTYKYPIAGASGIIGYSSQFNTCKPILTTGRVGTLGIVNKYHEPIWCADNVLVVESNFYEFAYMQLKSINYQEIAKGGVQSLLTQSELNKYPSIIPTTKDLISFENTVAPIFSAIRNYQLELTHLRKLQSLLTSKLA